MTSQELRQSSASPSPPSSSSVPPSQSTAVRQSWMKVLAIAPLDELERCVATLAEIPSYHFLRSPEIGLTMVRGRAGGTGEPFNLGEMTLTRCVIQLDSTSNSIAPTDSESSTLITGFGYVAGRSHRHAELVAVCDALLQHPEWRNQVQTQVIEPLQQSVNTKREQEAAEVESTRVNFFTMQRGESGL